MKSCHDGVATIHCFPVLSLCRHLAARCRAHPAGIVAGSDRRHIYRLGAFWDTLGYPRMAKLPGGRLRAPTGQRSVFFVRDGRIWGVFFLESPAYAVSVSAKEIPCNPSKLLYLNRLPERPL